MKTPYKILLAAIFITLIFFGYQSKTRYMTTPDGEIHELLSMDGELNPKRYVITEERGVKLKKQGEFLVEGDEWKLDIDGKEITYEIHTTDKFLEMCFIKARDSFGKKCEICIMDSSYDSVIRIDYEDGRSLVYTGKFEPI